jgi:DNA polymerase-3 subunit epsilon
VRQAVVDIETTGLDPRAGHRIIEIGCVELCHGELTGRQLHSCINPEQEISVEAELIHGLSNCLLASMPPFEAVVDGLLSILQDSELVVLNAPFVRDFLDAELTRAGRPSTQQLCSRAIDLRDIARRAVPGDRSHFNGPCQTLGSAQSATPLPNALGRAVGLADIYCALVKKAIGRASADG